MAHGGTRQAAIKNAEGAIRFWIKTAKDNRKEIPQPRGRLLVAVNNACDVPAKCAAQITWLHE